MTCQRFFSFPHSPCLPSAGRLLLMTVALASSMLAAGAAAPRPNIVVIYTDDQGYGDMSGASGYMLKRAAADELIHALRAIAAGNIYVDARLADKLVSTLEGRRTGVQSHTAELSLREHEVLCRIADGYSNTEIAAALGISVKAVETYKTRSMERLGLRSRVDIVRVARERKWTSD